MLRFRVLGFLAITLCLVACLCANAIVSEEDAKKKVKEVQAFTTKVLQKARTDYRDASYALGYTKLCRINAENAASNAEKIARGNPEAELIAQKARSAADKVVELYPNALAKAEERFAIVRKLLENATRINQRAEKAIYISPYELFDYTKMKSTAETVTPDAEALDKQIDNASLFSLSAWTAQGNIPQLSEDAQLAKFHVDAIVAVAKIETLLESAGTDIKHIEQKLDEINATVEEIKKLKEIKTNDASQYVSTLCFYAEEDFRSALSKLKGAQKRKEAMIKRKEEAVASLEKIKIEKEVKKAEEQSITAEYNAKKVEEEVPKLKKTLYSVTITVENTKSRKLSAMKAMGMKVDDAAGSGNGGNANPSNKNKPHRPVTDATGSPSKSGEKQTQPASTGQAANEITAPSITKPQRRPIAEKSEQAIKGAPVVPIDEQTGESQIEESNQPIRGAPVKSIAAKPNESQSEEPKRPISGETVESTKEKTREATYAKLTIPTSGSPDRSKKEKIGEQKNENLTPQISEKEVRPIMEKLKQPLKDRIEGAVIGGTELTRHFSSHSSELGDSAVAVSVSLLLALIACAAMH